MGRCDEIREICGLHLISDLMALTLTVEGSVIREDVLMRSLFHAHRDSFID